MPSTPTSRPVPYAKMNGAGNAILVLDLREAAPIDGATAQRLAARPRLAFDQLMTIEPSRTPDTTAFVRIFNQDGSRAGACGNGTRCVAWFLMDEATDALTVETDAGLLQCRRDDATTFTVDMGPPGLGWHDVPLRDAVEDTGAVVLEPGSGWIAALGPASALSMGNPHAVFFGTPATWPDLALVGPALEHHPMFPDRANISFAEILAPDRIRLDVWERGAGLTRACGSAACATLVAAVRGGRTERRAAVTLPGGTLQIEWRDADGHVAMTGPVELEHRGRLDPADGTILP